MVGRQERLQRAKGGQSPPQFSCRARRLLSWLSNDSPLSFLCLELMQPRTSYPPPQLPHPHPMATQSPPPRLAFAASFFLLGLLNNVLYVVILSAALDLVAASTPKVSAQGRGEGLS